MRLSFLKSFFVALLAGFACTGVSLSAQTLGYVPAIATYAGGTTKACASATDVYGDGCPATQALLSNPWMSVSDAQGNLYFSDLANNIVRRIDANTGIVTLIAGGGTVCAAKSDTVGDGCLATQATLKAPQGVRFDLYGNLMIADGGNNRVRRIDSATGIITTIAGTGTTAIVPPANTSPKAATSTNIGNPFGLAIDSGGNLYMACGAQSAVLIVLANKGQITGSNLIYTIAGNGTRGYTGDGGPGPQAELFQDRGVTIGPDGSIYIGDQNNGAVRKVTSPFQGGVFNPNVTVITTIAGTGTLGYSGDGGKATAAKLDAPEDVFLDNTNHLYAVGYGSTIAAGGDYLREVDLTTGFISTAAGTGTRETTGDGGPAAQAGIQGPQGGNYDRLGNIFIGSCPTCNVIRRISLNNDFLQTQSVGGTSAAQNIILQASAATTLASASIAKSTVAEFVLGTPSGCSVGGPVAQGAYCTLPVTFQPVYPGLRMGRLIAGDGSSTTSLGLWATGVASLPVFGTASITTVAGTGTAGTPTENVAASLASVNSPGGGIVDSQGNLFFADTGNHVVRRIDAVTGKITNVAGAGAPGYAGDGSAATAALLNSPASITIDAAGNLYISDTGNNVVRFVNADTGAISTIAGNGTAAHAGDGGAASAASLSQPKGLVVDAGGNIYVADTNNNVIRRFARGGPITTIAGTGVSGASGDGGPALFAQFNHPSAIAIDLAGDLYIADTGNGIVREVNGFGITSTFAGTVNASGTNSGDGAAATSASLTAPSSVALDAGGNVYIATGSQIRVVDSSGLINTVAGTGANAGYGGEGGSATAASLGSSNLSVILDSASNLYISAPSSNRIVLVHAATAPNISFGVQAATTQSASVPVPVKNAGNSALSITGLVVSANFGLDVSPSDACSTSTTLAPGRSCTLHVYFAPNTDSGSLSGTIVLTDNALNVSGATQTVQLSGSTHTVATTSTSISVSPAKPVYGSPATITATLVNSSQATGTFSFSVNGTSIGTATVAASQASIALPRLAVGTAGVTASYSGDDRNRSSSATASITIAPAVLTVTASNASRPQLTSNPAFTYTITGFVNGDNAGTAITGSPALSATAGLSSPQGIYPIVPTIGTLAAANYTFTFVNGTLTVGQPPPADFTFSASSTAISVTDGNTVKATLSLTSLYNYAGQAKLACTGLPTNVVCYFASGTLTGDPTAANATVATTLTIATDTLSQVSGTRSASLFTAFGIPALMLLAVGARRRRVTSRLMLLATLLVAAVGVTGCGNTLGQAVAKPGTYTISVTATDGSLSKSVPVTLTIN